MEFRLRYGRVWLPLLIAWTLCCAPIVTAQSAAQNDEADLIRKMQRRIDELEASQKAMQEKLDKLNAAPSVAAPPPAEAVPAPPPAEAVSSPQPEAEPQPTSHILGPVEFHGFSDFDYGRPWFEKLPPSGLKGSTLSFTSGDFDLFTNTRLSDDWSMLGEMLVTSDFTNEFSVEMDRLLLSYRKNDYFRISFGKFATSLGYYTMQFHRAQYFQTGIGRPLMYSDEDNLGILPTHNVGITASGLVPSGKLGLHWVAEVANGRASQNTAVPIQNFQDEGNGKAVNFAAYVRPDQVQGLQAGVSIYHDTLHPLNLPQVGQIIVTGHVVYVGSKLEWLNEGAIVRHSPQGTDKVYHDVTSYTQLSYAFGKYRPYFRYDYQNNMVNDLIFGSLGRDNGPSVGIDRRFSNYVIFKAQYSRLTEGPITGATNALQSQLAFAF